ncbi:hypothetical protein [Pseudoclavibacter soli]|uniref:hypothetical protein n=1 Tax=Pseudoclavibacter soli TaxID=452623 RepID=UPI0004146983|nr:hypothetical protein [Pseudoclavibacter soli]
MAGDEQGWRIEVEPEYERAVTRELNEYQQELLDGAVRGVLLTEGVDVCRTQWGKPLGQGLYEFRVHKKSKKQVMQRVDPDYKPAPGDEQTVTLRVFFMTHGRRLILLLTAYDKGRDPSKKKQQAAIATARTIAARVIRKW